MDKESSSDWVTGSDQSSASASDESDGEHRNCAAGGPDRESGVSDKSAYFVILNNENDGHCMPRMDDELQRMDQLVADLTAQRDRIKGESGIQQQAGTSVGRNAEFVSRANKQMEEANNVLSGVWMTAGPINKLPVELIEHIMHFIPIQHVFVCMSVNKNWEEAARLTVKKHKRVQLVYKLEVGIYNPLDLIVNKSHISPSRNLQLLARSLLQMQCLTHLNTSKCSILGRRYINPVILKNAATLQVLDTPENLPSSRRGPAYYKSSGLPSNSSPVIYRQLKKLACMFLSPGTKCPVLEELTIHPCCALGPVDQLPILTMRKFVFRSKIREYEDTNDTDSITGQCTRHDDYDEDERFVSKILQAAKRMVHLTDLTIYYDFDVDYNAPVDLISTLLDNFTSLVHLDLTVPSINFAFDQKMVQLVRQNPGLRHLKLYNFELSDIALTSIAGLRDLRHLDLTGRKSRFTVNGLLTLLRSPLRSLLLFFSLDVHGTTGDERKEITDEIDLLAAERGKPLKANKFEFLDSYTFEFELGD